MLYVLHEMHRNNWPTGTKEGDFWIIFFVNLPMNDECVNEYAEFFCAVLIMVSTKSIVWN